MSRRRSGTCSGGSSRYSRRTLTGGGTTSSWCGARDEERENFRVSPPSFCSLPSMLSLRRRCHAHDSLLIHTCIRTYATLFLLRLLYCRGCVAVVEAHFVTVSSSSSSSALRPRLAKPDAQVIRTHQARPLPHAAFSSARVACTKPNTHRPRVGPSPRSSPFTAPPARGRPGGVQAAGCQSAAQSNSKSRCTKAAGDVGQAGTLPHCGAAALWRRRRWSAVAAIARRAKRARRQR